MSTITQKSLSVITISTTLPRQCGIATFNDDVTRGLIEQGILVENIALERPGEHFHYSADTVGKISQNNSKQYTAAARLINARQPDVVLIEHEFGIFGGKYGAHVLHLLDTLTVPTAVIVHTYPFTQDDADQLARARMLWKIARRASLLITISDIARARLAADLRHHHIKTPVIHIPHGTPNVAHFPLADAKAAIGQSGKLILSTFGLIGERKGINEVIETLPALVNEFPNLVYRVLGRPHPTDKKAQHHFAYLTKQVVDLKLEDRVQFVPRFLSVAEIMHELQATDVYITYYRDPDQSSSGSLSYAVAAGCCIISTPYVHARELLDDGRGVLTPFNNREALTDSLLALLRNKKQRQKIQAAARAYGQATAWEQIAQTYAKALSALAVTTPQPTRATKVSIA